MTEGEFLQDGREQLKPDGVPKIESRHEGMMLAAVESSSFLTLSKKASTLLVKNPSTDSSCLELLELRPWGLPTKSEVAPPSVSVN